MPKRAASARAHPHAHTTSLDPGPPITIRFAIDLAASPVVFPAAADSTYDGDDRVARTCPAAEGQTPYARHTRGAASCFG